MEKVRLAQLLGVIINDYNGFVPTEKSICESMTEKYHWGNKTTRKKLQDLETLDLISCQRPGNEKWKKEYTLAKSQEANK